MKFTLTEFKKRYPNDNACLDKIFQLKYGHLEACPECGCKAEFRRIKTRRCYQCRHCYAQFYPTAGTPFEKTRKPLSDWFYVIFLFTTTRNGVAAKEIERQLGCGYETAWRMGHKIRELMNEIGKDKLAGFVEIDETYISKKSNGESTEKPILGMVERTGRVRAFPLKNTTIETVYPFIDNNIERGSKVSTDESALYKQLNSRFGFTHFEIKHATKVYRVGSATTNTIEGYFAQLKRTIFGTHLHVSYKYLDSYVNEVCTRYNNRKNQNGMFESILTNGVKRFEW
jgi:transposase